MISACITAQIDNGPKQLFKIKNADFQLLLENNPTITESNMVALSLLKNFFDLSTNDYWRNAAAFTENEPTLILGHLTDHFVEPTYPGTSLSLVSFTDYSLVTNLINNIPPNFDGSYSQWRTNLRNKTLSEVNTYINQYWTPGYITLNSTPKTLYIHKTDMFELSSESNTDGVTYIDGYDAISACIERNTVANIALNKAEIGLVADYPTIIFEAESSITYDYAFEAIEPVVSGGSSST